MTSSITLKPSIELFGHKSYIHNDISLKDFFSSNEIPIGTRILVYFSMLYNLDDNRHKKPEDRIFISNPGILRALGYDVKNYKSKAYDDHISAIQSALERYEQDKDCFFTREFQSKDEKWIPLYLKDSSGNMTYKPETRGLTKRRFILNVNRMKELLTALPDHVASIEVSNRSRSKRLINARPITLKDLLINEFIKTQVKDVQNARNINHYLADQLSKYGNFTKDQTMPSDADRLACTYIYTENPVIAMETISILFNKGRPE